MTDFQSLNVIIDNAFSFFPEYSHVYRRGIAFVAVMLSCSFCQRAIEGRVMRCSRCMCAAYCGR